MTPAHELTNRMRSLLRCELGAMADFLAALAEVIEKKLWRELGYASPFYFVRAEFELSAGAAYNRIVAAQLMLSFAEVEPALRSGKLNLSTVTVLAKVLTSENRDEVLPRFFGVSRSEAERIAAALRPAEVIPVRDVVTPIRPAASAVGAIAPARPQAVAPTGETSTGDAGAWGERVSHRCNRRHG
jgi:hypothetical protein